MTFPAQSPDLRRFPLVAGASRSVVRSPRSAAPRIRFLFVDSRVRFTLRSAYASRRTPCASLRLPATRFRVSDPGPGPSGAHPEGGMIRPPTCPGNRNRYTNSAMPASPFQASGETSPGKNDDLPRTIAGSTPLPLGRRSFAVSGPLAPVRSASYPVPVRRLTGSFHASFSVRLTERLALPFGPCDQVPGGLSPPSHRPCRAHHRESPPPSFGGELSFRSGRSQ